MIDKTKWKKIEKNIWQNIDEPKKFMVSLYYGRDARGRMKKSSKIVNGTLKDARNTLKQHEVDRLHEKVNVPTKATLEDVINHWNKNVGELSTEVTTQTSNRNLQRHMLEFFGDIRINK